MKYKKYKTPKLVEVNNFELTFIGEYTGIDKFNNKKAKVYIW